MTNNSLLFGRLLIKKKKDESYIRNGIHSCLGDVYLLLQKFFWLSNLCVRVCVHAHTLSLRHLFAIRLANKACES